MKSDQENGVLKQKTNLRNILSSQEQKGHKNKTQERFGSFDSSSKQFKNSFLPDLVQAHDRDDFGMGGVVVSPFISLANAMSLSQRIANIPSSINFESSSFQNSPDRFAIQPSSPNGSVIFSQMGQNVSLNSPPIHGQRRLNTMETSTNYTLSPSKGVPSIANTTQPTVVANGKQNKKNKGQPQKFHSPRNSISNQKLLGTQQQLKSPINNNYAKQESQQYNKIKKPNKKNQLSDPQIKKKLILSTTFLTQNGTSKKHFQDNNSRENNQFKQMAIDSQQNDSKGEKDISLNQFQQVSSVKRHRSIPIIQNISPKSLKVDLEAAKQEQHLKVDPSKDNINRAQINTSNRASHLKLQTKQELPQQKIFEKEKGNQQKLDNPALQQKSTTKKENNQQSSSQQLPIVINQHELNGLLPNIGPMQQVNQNQWDNDSIVNGLEVNQIHEEQKQNQQQSSLDKNEEISHQFQQGVEREQKQIYSEKYKNDNIFGDNQNNVSKIIVQETNDDEIQNKSEQQIVNTTVSKSQKGQQSTSAQSSIDSKPTRKSQNNNSDSNDRSKEQEFSHYQKDEELGQVNMKNDYEEEIQPQELMISQRSSYNNNTQIVNNENQLNPENSPLNYTTLDNNQTFDGARRYSAHQAQNSKLKKGDSRRRLKLVRNIIKQEDEAIQNNNSKSSISQNDIEGGPTLAAPSLIESRRKSLTIGQIKQLSEEQNYQKKSSLFKGMDRNTIINASDSPNEALEIQNGVLAAKMQRSSVYKKQKSMESTKSSDMFINKSGQLEKEKAFKMKLKKGINFGTSAKSKINISGLQCTPMPNDEEFQCNEQERDNFLENINEIIDQIGSSENTIQDLQDRRYSQPNTPNELSPQEQVRRGSLKQNQFLINHQQKSDSVTPEHSDSRGNNNLFSTAVAMNGFLLPRPQGELFSKITVNVIPPIYEEASQIEENSMNQSGNLQKKDDSKMEDKTLPTERNQSIQSQQQYVSDHQQAQQSNSFLVQKNKFISQVKEQQSLIIDSHKKQQVSLEQQQQLLLQQEQVLKQNESNEHATFFSNLSRSQTTIKDVHFIEKENYFQTQESLDQLKVLFHNVFKKDFEELIPVIDNNKKESNYQILFAPRLFILKKDIIRLATPSIAEMYVRHYQNFEQSREIKWIQSLKFSRQLNSTPPLNNFSNNTIKQIIPYKDDEKEVEDIDLQELHFINDPQSLLLNDDTGSQQQQSILKKNKFLISLIDEKIQSRIFELTAHTMLDYLALHELNLQKIQDADVNHQINLLVDSIAKQNQEAMRTFMVEGFHDDLFGYYENDFDLYDLDGIELTLPEEAKEGFQNQQQQQQGLQYQEQEKDLFNKRAPIRRVSRNASFRNTFKGNSLAGLQQKAKEGVLKGVASNNAENESEKDLSKEVKSPKQNENNNASHATISQQSTLNMKNSLANTKNHGTIKSELSNDALEQQQQEEQQHLSSQQIQKRQIFSPTKDDLRATRQGSDSPSMRMVVLGDNKIVDKQKDQNSIPQASAIGQLDTPSPANKQSIMDQSKIQEYIAKSRLILKKRESSRKGDLELLKIPKNKKDTTVAYSEDSVKSFENSPYLKYANSSRKDLGHKSKFVKLINEAVNKNKEENNQDSAIRNESVFIRNQSQNNQQNQSMTMKVNMQKQKISNLKMDKHSLAMRTHKISFNQKKNLNPISRMFLCVKENNIEELEELLVSYPTFFIDYKDHEGNTLLGIAAQCGFSNIVDFLLKKNAGVNLYNKQGDTPLHLALAYSHYTISDQLIKAGASQNFLNNDNKTPWDLAS